jgi:glucosamine-6-phosphate deaminase
LGLATGSSPIKVYQELVRMHKEEGLSFKNVITFNLDEYYPMQPNDINSYVYFMNEHLFSHIDIEKSNIHIPDGTVNSEGIDDFCLKYEEDIEKAGGLDIQILGIGRTGHIGFNEPGSTLTSNTRQIVLNEITREDAAPAFDEIENVPTVAITMGIGTIMKAKRVILMAWGKGKADIIQQTIEGEICDSVPATFLQHHKNVGFFLDKDAACKLT